MSAQASMALVGTGSREATRTPALARLVAPLTPAVFEERYWSREFFLSQGRGREAWADLFSLADLDRALVLACRIPGAVEELNGHVRPIRHRTPATACAAARLGRSLRIDAMQRVWWDVAVFCRRLEQDLSCPVNVNAYITPPGERALDRHFDTHDVFVLQIHGRKRWRLFGRAVVDPLESLPLFRGEGQDQMRRFRIDRKKRVIPVPEAVQEEFELEAGDVLYLPRGFWHEAATGADEASCHLTIGVQSFTYLDLLAAALAEAAWDEPGLRASLPLGFATHSDRGAEAGRHLEASGWAGFLQPYQIAGAATLADIFRRGRSPLSAALAGQLHGEAPAAGLGEPVSVAVGVVRTVAPLSGPAGMVRLGFGRAELDFPAAFEPALRHVAAHDRFCARDLPGPITDEERVSLVALLAEQGLVVTEPAR